MPLGMKRSYAGPEMKRSYADPEMKRSYAGLATTRSYAAALSLVLLITSCASAPMRHVYVLGSAREATTDTFPARNADRIQVEPIAIPDYLDSTDIVMRQGAHEVVSSSTGRWGDRLAVGLRDALSSDLSARLPRDFITTARDLDPLARQLLLNVSALDVWENGRCILTASWSISAKGGGSPILEEDTFMIQAGSGTGADAQAASGGDSIVVASMATAVAKLADRIAASLAAIDQSPSASTGNAAP